MADEQQPRADKSAREERTYPLERLISEAPAFLECEPHVAAGALVASKKKNLTIQEAKGAVRSFLSREVE